MTTEAATTLTAAIVLGALQAWNTYKSGKRDKAIAATATVVKEVAIKQEETAKTVEVIHTLTNSNMGAQKKTLAEVSAAKAVITNDPKDHEAAAAALADYLAHVEKEAKVNAEKSI